MTEGDQRYSLNVGIPNGLILMAVGVLVLLTPLTTEMTPAQARIDLLAGLLMLAGGAVSLGWGLLSRRRRARARP